MPPRPATPECGAVGNLCKHLVLQFLCQCNEPTGGSVGKEYACSAEDLFPSLDQEDPLEKETETHSSILDWEIPWTEESGRLQFMGSQRVRQDLQTKPSPPVYFPGPL